MKWSMIAWTMLVIGCGAEERALGISEERFIATMVELRRAALTAGQDTARFDQLREQVLEEQGVTAAELRSYVEASSTDLDHLAAVWDSISARLADPEAR